MAKHKFTDYYLVVNLDERGDYSATVYDPNDKAVYQIESADQVREMQDDGFLKYKPDEDLDRLTRYLMDMDIIPNFSQVYSEDEFEDRIRDRYNEEEESGNYDIELIENIEGKNKKRWRGVVSGQAYNRLDGLQSQGGFKRYSIDLYDDKSEEKVNEKGLDDFMKSIGVKYEKGGEVNNAFTNELKQAIQNVFPSSGVDVAFSKQFLPSITIRFTIGSGRDEYANGIIQNDAMFTVIHIFGVDDSGNPTPNMSVESSSGSFYVKSTNPMFAYERIKTGWRNFKAKDKETVVRKITEYFKKAKATLLQNIDKLDDYTKELVKKKYMKQGGQTTGVKFSDYYASRGAVITGGSYFGASSKMAKGGIIMPDDIYWSLYELDQRLVDVDLDVKKESDGSFLLIVGKAIEGADDRHRGHKFVIEKAGSGTDERKVWDWLNENNPVHISGAEMASAMAKGGRAGSKKKKKSAPKKQKSWQEIALQELREHEGDDDIEITREDIGHGGFEAESGNTSWLVFESYDDAEKEAIDRVYDDLENEPELFSQDWLNNFLSVTDTDRRIIAGEEADRYVGDIEDEDDGDRVAEEGNMKSEWDDIKEKIDNLTDSISLEEDDDMRAKLEKELEDAEKEKEKILEEAKENVRSDYYDNWYNGLKDPVSFLVDEQGIYSKEDLLKQSFISIDAKEASEDAVSTDGVAHFLSRYDGNQIDLASGAVAYKN